MPVIANSKLSSSVINTIFLDKTQDDETVGVVGLKNVLNVDSGAGIDNAQRYINEIADASGVAGEGDATSKTYSSNNYISDGDSRKVVAGKLDTQVKLNADDIADIQADYGVANGLAILDGSGLVPTAQLPNTLLKYQGTWDASTNTPTLANTDTSVDNFWYRVNVAGSVDFGAGSITFAIGDKVVSNGTVWEKWDTTDEVISVNSQTGAVILDADSIDETTRFWDIKHNRNSSIDPAVTNDNTEGYVVGSTWFNSVLEKKFTLQDATTGAANWVETGGNAPVDSVNSQTGVVVLDADDIAETATRFWDIKHEYDSAVDPTVNEDSGDGYQVGSTWFNSTAGTMFRLQDATVAAAVWVLIGAPAQIRVEGRGNGGGSITANVTNVDFTETIDNTSSWSGTVYTHSTSSGIAEPLMVSGGIRVTSATNFEVRAYINGTFYKALGARNNDIYTPFSGVVYLSDTDTLSIRLSVTSTLSNAVQSHNISINRIN